MPISPPEPGRMAHRSAPAPLGSLAMRKRERNKQRLRRHQRRPPGGQALAQRVRDEAVAMMEAILDPATPADVAAALIVSILDGGPVPPSLVEAMAEALPGRPHEVAAAALASGEGLTELSLAASAALHDRRLDEAAGYLTRAIDLSDHPLLRFQMATVAVDGGDLFGGLDRLDDLLVDAPETESAQA
ncbi:MAG: hypothetical protein ACREQ5_22705, partial [Candidatus Dormibacteria bacterium]